MKLFSVVIKQDHNNFHAQVPDLPNLHVTGTSIADTIDKMRSAIINYLQSLSDNGQDLPHPQNITTYLLDPKFAGQTWAIISLNSLLFDSNQKSFSLHLPRPLLAQIQEKIGYQEHDIERFILTAIEHELSRINT